MTARRLLLTAMCLALMPVQALAQTDRVVLLYTNDIHDHVGPGAGGRGGLAYVGGYVRGIRAQSDEVLLLDAGDSLEKGDLLPFRTKGRATFEAMAQIGYDATVPGNHDITGYGQGLPLMRRAMEGTIPVLCGNLVDDAGQSIYPSSRIVQIDGVDVGIVAATSTATWTISLRDSKNLLSWEETLDLLAVEAKALRPQVHLLVALLHFPSRGARSISQHVPEFDVLISGHDHEILEQPIVVEETGALIVQAGAKSQYVGRLDLVVDLEQRSIREYSGHLVPMDHGSVEPDARLAAWIESQEATHAPGARETLAWLPREYRKGDLAGLYGDALREECDVEVTVTNRMVAQNMLPAGDVDRNAVFSTGAALEPERAVFRTEMRGCEILRWIDHGRFRSTYPQWRGFKAEVDYERTPGERVISSDLDPDRVYSVAVLGADWAALKGETGWAKVFKIQPRLHPDRLLPCSMPSLGAWGSIREFFRTRVFRRPPIPPRQVELLDVTMTEVLQRYLSRRFPVSKAPPGSR